MAEELEALDEATARLGAALDPEGQDGTPAPGQVLLLAGVPRARLETGVGDPRHLVTRLEPRGHRGGVLHVTLHAQTEGLHTLEEQERVEGGDGRSEVAQVLQAGLQHEPRREQGLGELAEDQAVVARVGLGEPGEPPAPLVVEHAAVDDHTTDGGAVPADELGRGVDDDVGAVAQRLGQVRGRQGVVHHQRDAVAMGDSGDPFEVEDVALRIAERLRVERLGVGSDGGLPRVEVVRVLDERDLHAELGKGVVEQVVGAPVQRCRGHDVPAVLRQVEEGDRFGSLAAGHRQGRHAAFEGRDALLEDRLGGIHDPGVDVAQFLEPEERSGVSRVPEGVAGGLVDRNRPGPGGRVRLCSSVDLSGFEAPFGHDLVLLQPSPGRSSPTETSLSAVDLFKYDHFGQLLVTGLPPAAARPAAGTTAGRPISDASNR